MVQSSEAPEEATYPPLRQLLDELDWNALVGSCKTRCSFEEETIQDMLLDVMARMLQKEERFAHSFPNVAALSVYIRKVALRDLFREQKGQVKSVPETSSQGITPNTPEQALMNALEQQSLEEVMQEVTSSMKGTTRIRDDSRQLLVLLLSAPDRYMSTRQSGPEKGKLCFDIQDLSRTLKWDRSRVYDRLERIRKAMEHQLTQMD